MRATVQLRQSNVSVVGPDKTDSMSAASVSRVFGVAATRAAGVHSTARSAPSSRSRVARCVAAIARWHEAGIVCHVGYIIGFPADTYTRVMEDVRALHAEFDVDQASFFMLTPLPGSADHRAAVAAGMPLDPDYNRFDSFHAVQPHPTMSADETIGRISGLFP